MECVIKYLSELKLSEPTVFRNLTMFGIEASAEGVLEYLTLDDAIRLGVARVSEISDSGSVPELRFTNSAGLPVLILDGEELLGAKQNRTVNLTILAPPKETVIIPVSCVEAGRWHHQNDHFAMSNRHHFARGRAARTVSVSRSMRDEGLARSDQRRVWADISAKAARMKAPSATQAMAEIFDRHRSSVEDYVRAFSPVEAQTGALFAIGAEIVGVDLFDRGTTLASVLPKLVRSYAIDAMEIHREDNVPARESDAKTFLAHIADAEVRSYGAVGLGDDLRLSGSGVVGGGLVVDNHVIHLAAFADDSDSDHGHAQSGRMARMTSRRRSFWRR